MNAAAGEDFRPPSVRSQVRSNLRFLVLHRRFADFSEVVWFRALNPNAAHGKRQRGHAHRSTRRTGTRVEIISSSQAAKSSSGRV
jgi:hypothetical protein